METMVPKTSAALSSLLRADFITQWRNRRSTVLILLVPVIILISWKGAIDKLGATFALSTCITLGLMAIGLMGYSNAIARDRDKGIFQRLRVTPVPTWSIMVSRLIVQFAMTFLVTAIVFFAGYYIDKITLQPAGYIVTFFTAIVGGALYLGLGQMIVGLVKNAETVNSTTRLVYFVFIMVGMFGELGVLGEQFKEAVHWSPYGTVKHILAASMQPSTWNNDATMALLITIAYATIFGLLGIKRFKWSTQ
ncbi:MAG: ABC transporter permease [Ginsengibacter sp.]